MSTIKRFNDKLPDRFPDWMRFYEKFNWKEIKPDEILKYEEMYISGFYIHEFTQDYLKARCFDEISAVTFDSNDLLYIIQALHQSGFGNDFPVKQKADIFLRLAHDKEHLARFYK